MWIAYLAHPGVKYTQLSQDNGEYQFNDFNLFFKVERIKQQANVHHLHTLYILVSVFRLDGIHGTPQ